MCAGIREECWDAESPVFEGSFYNLGICVRYRARYPEDNPFPDAGVDGDVENPDGGELGGGGNGGAGGSGGDGGSAGSMTDGGADASAANGNGAYGFSCIPQAPDYFNNPQPVWLGPTHLVPAGCPHELGAHGGLDYFDVRAPENKTCPKCACEAPTGHCSGAIDSLILRGGSCQQLPSKALDFTPPKEWNGSCLSEKTVAMDSSCSLRDGIPCVNSILTGTLALPEQDCQPVEIPVPKAINENAVWGQAVLSCNSEPNDDIAHANWETCIPSANEWRSCVRHVNYGIHECKAESDYRDRFIVYPKNAIIDDRTCSPCECSAIGGSCTGELAVSSDDSCQEPVITLPVDSSAAHCQDFPANTQSLGSKELTKLEYVPGMCDARGGVPSGSIKFDETYAVTWCCLRLDYVRPPQD